MISYVLIQKCLVGTVVVSSMLPNARAFCITLQEAR